MVRREGLVPARNAGMSVGDEYRDRQLDLTATNLAIVEDRVHDLLPNSIECGLLIFGVLGIQHGECPRRGRERRRGSEDAVDA